MTTATFCLALGIAFGLKMAALAADPTPAEARAALERWFAKAAEVKTVQAEFDQLRKLKSVRNPLRKPGRMWLDKGAGRFRWQVGEPPAIVAVRGSDGTMTVLDEKEKSARVWTKDAIEAEEKQGRGQGLAVLNSMQGATMESFDREFELVGGEQDRARPGTWRFEWKFKDGRISLAVLRLAITANVEEGTLEEFTLHMRDGSSLGTVVRSRTLNARVPADTFKVDTAGYKVEVMAPK